MAEERVQGRLTAILAADVVGYPQREPAIKDLTNSFLREQQRGRKSAAPSICAASGTFCPITRTHLKLNPRPTKSNQLRYHGVDGDGPFLGVPVVGGFRVQCERPGVSGGVIDERLQKRRINIVAVNRLDVICQTADRPGTFLNESDGRWAAAPFPHPKSIVCRCRQVQYRANPPDKAK